MSHYSQQVLPCVTSAPAFDQMQVIDDLAFRVRQLSAEHFREARRARVMCERYVAAEILGYKDVIAVSATCVELIHTHRPTDSAADWEAIAHELRVRWRRVQPKPLRLYFATSKTVQRLGGDMRGRLNQLDCISHDSGTSAVFYSLVASNPALRKAWVPEERIPEVYGVVHPDALLADANGPRIVVEMCGQYSAQRLAKLASFATAQHLPLQLWTIAEERT